MSRLSITFLLASVGLTATHVAAQSLADSAGLRRWYYPRNATAPVTWSVDRQPVRTIGGAEATGKTEFSGIAGTVRLSNGHVAVADRAATEVRLFDARGNYLRDVGRKGRGPGEYDGILTLVRIADTLVVADFQGRVAVFSSDGSLKRSLPRPQLPNAKGSGFLGALADGSMLYGAEPTSRAATQGTNVLHLNVYALKGATSPPVVAIGNAPAAEVTNTGGLPRTLTLGAAMRVVSAANRFCIAWSKSWELTCYAGPGAPIFRTVRDVPASPLLDSDKEAWRTRFRIANKAFTRDSVETWLSRITFAEQRSTIGRIILSPLGELWVSDFDVTEYIEFGRPGLGTSDGEVTWHVLAADGRWIADIDMPARFRLVEVEGDHITGIQRDQDDVESVVVYRVKRR